jgi:nitrate/nitrite transporter NarK
MAAKLVRLTGSTATARRILACSGFAGAAGMLVLSIRSQDATTAMMFMGLASFCNDLVMPGAWATCMDVGGKFAGTIAGSMNMMGNIAGFIAPVVGAHLLRHYGGDWNVFLYSMAGAYLLGTLVWPFIQPTKPLPGSE